VYASTIGLVVCWNRPPQSLPAVAGLGADAEPSGDAGLPAAAGLSSSLTAS